MSTLNLVLQNVSLMRATMEDEMGKVHQVQEQPSCCSVSSGRKASYTGVSIPCDWATQWTLFKDNVERNSSQNLSCCCSWWHCGQFWICALHWQHSKWVKDGKDLQEFMVVLPATCFKSRSVEKYCTAHPIRLPQDEFEQSLFYYWTQPKTTTKSLKSSMDSFLQKLTDRHCYQRLWAQKLRLWTRRTRSFYLFRRFMLRLIA